MTNERYEWGFYEGCKYARTWAAWPWKLLIMQESIQANGGPVDDYGRGYLRALDDAIKTIHDHERKQPC
jgi:hypothetical protein